MRKNIIGPPYPARAGALIMISWTNPEKTKTAKLAQRVPQRRANGQNTRPRQNSEKDRFQRLLQKSVRETERQGFANNFSTGTPIVLQKAANKSNSPKWTRSENPTMPVQARSQ